VLTLDDDQSLGVVDRWLGRGDDGLLLGDIFLWRLGHWLRGRRWLGLLGRLHLHFLSLLRGHVAVWCVRGLSCCCCWGVVLWLCVGGRERRAGWGSFLGSRARTTNSSNRFGLSGRISWLWFLTEERLVFPRIGIKLFKASFPRMVAFAGGSVVRVVVAEIHHSMAFLRIMTSNRALAVAWLFL
jgi:hypothetical protein